MSISASLAWSCFSGTKTPGKGTAVTVKGAEKGVIEGKDFADALFSVWLGAHPVQEDLKKELLKG